MAAHLISGAGAHQLYRTQVAKYWPHYLFGLASILVTNLTEVAIPKVVQWSIDTVGGRDLAFLPGFLRADSRVDTAANLIVGMLVIMVIGMVGRAVWRQTLARLSHRGGRDLRGAIWNHLRHRPLAFFAMWPLGDIMNRSTGDIANARNILGFTLVLSADALFFSILAFACMIAIDPTLALLCMVSFLFLPRVIARLASREHKEHEEAQQELSRLSDLVAQSVTSMRVQKAAAMEEAWEKRLGTLAEEYARLRQKVLRTAASLIPLTSIPSVASYICLMTFGLYRVMAGDSLSIGEFVGFASYVAMMQSPLVELSDCVAEWQRGTASLERIAELMRAGIEEPPAGTAGSNLAGDNAPGQAVHTAAAAAEKLTLERPHVLAGQENHAEEASSRKGLAWEVRDLTHRYGNGYVAFQDISFALDRGCALSVHGRIGSGKSTLLQVLGGLLPVTWGHIALLGTSLKSLSRQEIIQRVAILPQNTMLLSGTIRDNLVLHRGHEFADEQLWAALAATEMTGEVDLLRGRLDAPIFELGGNLSGGQRQRLSLARALLLGGSCLLLDDSLSAIDEATLTKILTYLEVDMRTRGRTLIWVSHQPLVHEFCDFALYMPDRELPSTAGEIVAGGDT